MRKTMRKITVALLMIAMLAGTFAGCSGDGDNGELSHEALGYQWEDQSKPIVKEKNLIEFEVLAQNNPMTPDYEDLKVFQDLYNSTNVDIKWEHLSTSAYSERKSLILADKENWPDAIYAAYLSDAELVRYSTRKSLVNISDYLKYMPNFSRILELRPDIRKMIELPDGNIYSLPRVSEMGVTTNENFLFMNKNWLKKLVDDGEINFITNSDIKDGLQLDLTQMEAILTKFKANDMNGNSKNDEIPMSFVYNNWQGNQTDLYGAFGLPENVDHMTVIDDKIVCTATDAKFMAATNYLSKWVDKGLISKSSFEHTQDAFLASGKGTEKLGAFYWWEEETVVANPENYILCRPLKGLNGEQVLGLTNFSDFNKSVVVLMSTCKNPEVLLSYFDRFYDPVMSAQISYGPIGIVYEEERDADGKLVQKPIPDGMTADEFRLKNAPLGLFFLTKPEWDNVVNMEPRAQKRLERLELYANPYNPKNVKRLPELSFTMDEINTLSLYLTNVQDYIYGSQTEWLLKGGVTQAKFDTFKATLNDKVKLGEVLKVYQAAYDRYLAG